MYPPVAAYDRRLSKPITIDGVIFPAKTLVAVVTWCVHHNPSVWENHNVSNRSLYSELYLIIRNILRSHTCSSTKSTHIHITIPDCSLLFLALVFLNMPCFVFLYVDIDDFPKYDFGLLTSDSFIYFLCWSTDVVGDIYVEQFTTYNCICMMTKGEVCTNKTKLKLPTQTALQLTILPRR